MLTAILIGIANYSYCVLYILHTYTLLTVVGVNFNQTYYEVNETSIQIQIVLILSSPLPFDVTATVLDYDHDLLVISESIM